MHVALVILCKFPSFSLSLGVLNINLDALFLSIMQEPIHGVHMICGLDKLYICIAFLLPEIFENFQSDESFDLETMLKIHSNW
jgi:hypothetical protein